MSALHLRLLLDIFSYQQAGTTDAPGKVHIFTYGTDGTLCHRVLKHSWRLSERSVSYVILCASCTKTLTATFERGKDYQWEEVQA